MYSRKQFDADVAKLRELIKKCEELEVNNRIILTQSILKIKSTSRGITSNENTNNKRV